jgi:transposase-like protein
MISIVSGILSLVQYLSTKKDEPALYSLECCLNCGKSGLWRHGHYARKADRQSSPEESLNPIYIQRLYCPNCAKTCSVLPECIPPRRWYLWQVQQVAFLLILSGHSLRETASKVMPTRGTISRWVKHFREEFIKHKNALVNHFIDLGRTNGFVEFWQACLEIIALSGAMRLCHVSGVLIP